MRNSLFGPLMALACDRAVRERSQLPPVPPPDSGRPVDTFLRLSVRSPTRRVFVLFGQKREHLSCLEQDIPMTYDL
jgi:hypothetical protein